MVVLDSDILVAFLMGRPESLEKLNQLEKKGERSCTTTINAFELFQGALLHHNPVESTRKLEIFLDAFELLTFNKSASKTAAEISVELRKKGEIIDFQDIAIAAISLSNNEKIVTRNTKHFSRVKGLKIEKW